VEDDALRLLQRTFTPSISLYLFSHGEPEPVKSQQEQIPYATFGPKPVGFAIKENGTASRALRDT
jgi:hypothetical protein